MVSSAKNVQGWLWRVRQTLQLRRRKGPSLTKEWRNTGWGEGLALDEKGWGAQWSVVQWAAVLDLSWAFAALWFWALQVKIFSRAPAPLLGQPPSLYLSREKKSPDIVNTHFCKATANLQTSSWSCQVLNSSLFCPVYIIYKFIIIKQIKN